MAPEVAQAEVLPIIPQQRSAEAVRPREQLRPTHVVALREGDSRHSLAIDGNPKFAVVGGEKVRFFPAVVLRDQDPEWLELGDKNEAQLEDAGGRQRTETKSKVWKLLPLAAVAGLAASCSGGDDDISTKSSDAALAHLYAALEAAGLTPQEAGISEPGQEARGAYPVEVDGTPQVMVPILKPDPASPTGQVELFIQQGSFEAILDGEGGDIPEAVQLELDESVTSSVYLNPNVTGFAFDPATNKIYYSHKGSGATGVCDYNPVTKTVSDAQLFLGGGGGIPLNVVTEDDGKKYLLLRNIDENIRKINIDNPSDNEDTTLPADCGGYTRLNDGTYLVPIPLSGYCVVRSGATLSEAIGNTAALLDLNMPEGPDGVELSVHNPIAIVPPMVIDGVEYHLMYTGKTGIDGEVVGQYVAVWIPVGPVCGDGTCDEGEEGECLEDCPIVGPDVTEPTDVIEDTSGAVDAAADGGPADTGPEDTGPEDTGPEDTGPEDGEPADGEPGETGPEDTGADTAQPDTGAELPTPDTTATECVEGIPGTFEMVEGDCEVTICPIDGSDSFTLDITQDNGAECHVEYTVNGVPGKATILISDKEDGPININGYLHDIGKGLPDEEMEMEIGLHDKVIVDKEGQPLDVIYEGLTTAFAGTSGSVVAVEKDKVQLQCFEPTMHVSGNNFSMVVPADGEVYEVDPKTGETDIPVIPTCEGDACNPIDIIPGKTDAEGGSDVGGADVGGTEATNGGGGGCAINAPKGSPAAALMTALMLLALQILRRRKTAPVRIKKGK